MNTKVLTVLLIVCITIIAYIVCITILVNNKGTNNTLDDSLEGVVLEVKENTVTNTGLTIILKNVTPNEYTYGNSFWVEEKVESGWCKVPYVTEGNFVFNAIGHILGENSVREQEIGWKWLYGELSPGHYRIVKDILYLRSPGDYDEFYISTEFTIDLGIY